MALLDSIVDLKTLLIVLAMSVVIVLIAARAAGIYDLSNVGGIAEGLGSGIAVLLGSLGGLVTSFGTFIISFLSMLLGRK